MDFKNLYKKIYICILKQTIIMSVQDFVVLEFRYSNKIHFVPRKWIIEFIPLKIDIEFS